MVTPYFYVSVSTSSVNFTLVSPVPLSGKKLNISISPLVKVLLTVNGKLYTVWFSGHSRVQLDSGSSGGIDEDADVCSPNVTVSAAASV
jgi:hypothetical protein